MTGEEFENSLQALLEDRVSGSRHLALRAAGLLNDSLAMEDLPRAGLIKLLRNACRRLERAHTSLRSVVALCDDVMLIIDTGLPEERLRRTLTETLHRWGELYESRVLRQILSHVAPLMLQCNTIVSHSQSSTVFAVLAGLVERSPDLKVIQSVSAPNDEGKIMAAKLAELGIAVELIADAGLAEAAGRADTVLVGADVVCTEGVVNKLGTLPLALGARHFRTPIHAVFDTSKLLKPGEPVTIEEHDPTELAALNTEGIGIRNVYFEITPLALFDRLVTEDGAYEPAQMLHIIEGLAQPKAEEAEPDQAPPIGI